ncbi:MAG: rhomboid family intramembrane serine protease [Candidatus Thermoplasmatota archaeon]
MAIHERVWEQGDAGRPQPHHAVASRPWRPEGTYALLGIIVGVWLVQQLELSLVRSAIAQLQAGATELPFGVGVFRGEPVFLHQWTFVINTDVLWRPWTLITSTVAHDTGGFTHLLFNGVTLFFFGPSVERLVGTRRFLLLFFLGGALSGVLQVELSAAFGNGGGALGASGALMLLFGLLMVLMPNEKLLVYGIVPVPFWIAGIGYAALDVLGAFNPASRIGNYAHLAGMALGLGYGLWMRADWRRRGVRLVRE